MYQTIHALAQEFLQAGMAPPAPADYSSGAAVPKEQIEAAATAVEEEVNTIRIMRGRQKLHPEMTLGDYGMVGPREVHLCCQACETSAHKIAQRSKQIGFGRNTIGYERYSEYVPRRQRRWPQVSRPTNDRHRRANMHSCCRWTGACRLTSRPPGPVARTQHQDTPDVAQFCSKRAFDGQIRAWRRYLHTWDDKPPKNPPAHVGGGDDQASFVARGSGGAAAAGGGGAGVVAAAAAPALDYVSDSDEEQPSSTAATAAPLGGDDQAAGAEAAGAGGGGELLGCFVLDVVGSHGGGAAGAAPGPPPGVGVARGGGGPPGIGGGPPGIGGAPPPPPGIGGGPLPPPGIGSAGGMAPLGGTAGAAAAAAAGTVSVTPSLGAAQPVVASSSQPINSADDYDSDASDE
jgi:hypothetical protein